MAKLSENSRKVYDFMVKMDGKANVTAADIAEALELTTRQVNGIVTSAFQKKGLMQRVPAEITNEDGTHTAVKYVELTDEGRAFDPDAEPAAE